jgi:DNA-binding PadR family transcriptional regulator
VLALLQENPGHGYALMAEMARRSGGLWRPSPGSIYPVLQQLRDEGLVSVADSGGRRVFSLTEAGRESVRDRAQEIGSLWDRDDPETMGQVSALHEALDTLGAAVHQVAQLADPEQVARARRSLDQARRSMYLILSEETSAPRPGSGAGSDRREDGTAGDELGPPVGGAELPDPPSE